MPFVHFASSFFAQFSFSLRSEQSHLGANVSIITNLITGGRVLVTFLKKIKVKKVGHAEIRAVCPATVTIEIFGTNPRQLSEETHVSWECSPHQWQIQSCKDNHSAVLWRRTLATRGMLWLNRTEGGDVALSRKKKLFESLWHWVDGYKDIKRAVHARKPHNI